MHAPGIFGHVASDRAGDLRRGIRRIEEMVCSTGFGDGKVRDAGLHAREAPPRGEFENPVEPGEHEQYRTRNRQAAAREAGAGATRDDRHAPAMTDRHHGLHFGGAPRQHDDLGHAPIGGESVAFEGDARLARGQHIRCAYGGAQLVSQRRHA